MKRIFDGEIYDVVKVQNGIVFSYNGGVNEDRSINVCFKMISLETKEMNDVGKNVYLLAKYGPDYRNIIPYCDNYITTKALPLTDNRTLLCTKDGKITLVEANGEASFKSEIKYKGCAPSDIVFYENSLWGCFQKSDCLIRLNLANLREELRVGKKGGFINSPYSVSAQGDTLYVCCTEGKRIIKLDMKTYNADYFYDFLEPVYAFIQIENHHFALLESGLYAI